ncbi:MAG: hypothetical protein ICV63_19420 [Coleofasciculus sp. Co-bin14]|nr:hypothetical protein [Coleofasciculus sp. Co-bin14]
MSHELFEFKTQNPDGDTSCLGSSKGTAFSVRRLLPALEFTSSTQPSVNSRTQYSEFGVPTSSKPFFASQ